MKLTNSKDDRETPAYKQRKAIQKLLWGNKTFAKLEDYEMGADLKKDLTNLIHKACNQARIDELKTLARNHWQKPIPEMSVLDRIKELKEDK